MSKIIIVDSVKGGCGKTTEAILTAIEKAKKLDIDPTKISQNNVCVIDMDLQGTSMERMIADDKFIKEGRKKVEDIKIISKADTYLNELADEHKSWGREYKSRIKLEISNTQCCYVDFIISSPQNKDIRKFKASGNSNYSMQITPTHFRGVIKKVVEELIKLEYEYIIFDMPPNSDPYTDCIFDLFLDTSYRGKMKPKKKDGIGIDSVSLKIVSTYDKSHIYANVEWLVSLIEGPDHHWQNFDKVYFILNNNCIAQTHISETLQKDIISYIKSEIPQSADIHQLYIGHREYNNALALHFLFNVSGAKRIFADFKDITIPDLNFNHCK